MKKIFVLVCLAAAVMDGYAQDKLYADEFPLGDVDESDSYIGDIGDKPNDTFSICLHYFRLCDVAA